MREVEAGGELGTYEFVCGLCDGEFGEFEELLGAGHVEEWGGHQE